MRILDAKLDNGALSTTSALRKKFCSPVQQAFEECLSPLDCDSFNTSFYKHGNNSDFLKIKADSNGPFPGPSNFWTDDGAVLPDIIPANVDALFTDHGAASRGAGPLQARHRLRCHRQSAGSRYTQAWDFWFQKTAIKLPLTMILNATCKSYTLVPHGFRSVFRGLGTLKTVGYGR